jgi:pyocin large subunit-like protein
MAAPKKSYSRIVEEKEFNSRFNAVRKYVDEINKIVNAGPKGGVTAEARASYNMGESRQPNARAMSTNDGNAFRMTKAGAISARKAKVLRGTQKKAK